MNTPPATHTHTYTTLSLCPSLCAQQILGRVQTLSPSSSWHQAQGPCVSCAPTPADSAETCTHTGHLRSWFSGHKLFLPQWLEVKDPLVPAAGTDSPLTRSEATAPARGAHGPIGTPAAAPHMLLPQQLALSPYMPGIGNEVRWMRAGRTCCGDQVQAPPLSSHSSDATGPFCTLPCPPHLSVYPCSLFPAHFLLGWHSPVDPLPILDPQLYIFILCKFLGFPIDSLAHQLVLLTGFVSGYCFQ